MRHLLLCLIAAACCPGADAPHPGGQGHGPQAYNLTQATSSRAQLHTIAFSGVAFLTGSFAASTFLPPGKACDYFGFQYLRDIDATGAGHNPKFLDRVVGNVTLILDEEQHRRFRDLAVTQAPRLEDLARRRLPVIYAFHQLAEGHAPADRPALDREAVGAAVGALFRQDADLSLERATVMAAVARALTPAQRQALEPLHFGDFATWPDRGEVRDLLRDRTRDLPPGGNVAYMTYLSEWFSWVKGSVDADTYFCPERHATYFGGFYLKDKPAMGRKDYDISTRVTGDSGQALVERILTPAQRKRLEDTVAAQRPALDEIVSIRRRLCTALRGLLDGRAPERTEVLALGERYGVLDGTTSADLAILFARIGQELSADQRQELARLRPVDAAPGVGYYLYSRPVTQAADLAAASAALFKAR